MVSGIVIHSPTGILFNGFLNRYWWIDDHSPNTSNLTMAHTLVGSCWSPNTPKPLISTTSFQQCPILLGQSPHLNVLQKLHLVFLTPFQDIFQIFLQIHLLQPLFQPGDAGHRRLGRESLQVLEDVVPVLLDLQGESAMALSITNYYRTRWPDMAI